MLHTRHRMRLYSETLCTNVPTLKTVVSLSRPTLPLPDSRTQRHSAKKIVPLQNERKAPNCEQRNAHAECFSAAVLAALGARDPFPIPFR